MNAGHWGMKPNVERSGVIGRWTCLGPENLKEELILLLERWLIIAVTNLVPEWPPSNGEFSGYSSLWTLLYTWSQYISHQKCMVYKLLAYFRSCMWVVKLGVAFKTKSFAKCWFLVNWLIYSSFSRFTWNKHLVNDTLWFEDGFLPSQKERRQSRYSPICFDDFRWTKIEQTQSVTFKQEKIWKVEHVDGCV